MRTAPPWAKQCRNPFVRHDWDWIPFEWEPDTSFQWVRMFNERCTCCHVVVARMVAAQGQRHSMYRQSTYPEDYRYTEMEEPSAVEYADWYIEDREERHGKRRLQVVATA